MISRRRATLVAAAALWASLAACNSDRANSPSRELPECESTIPTRPSTPTSIFQIEPIPNAPEPESYEPPLARCRRPAQGL